MCAHERKEVSLISCTIKELAQICGVSEGTVDRALNNRPGIKASTKERILTTAAEMNYHPNHMAQCLATGSTKTIGVIGVDLRNNFFAMMIESIEMAAKEKGYFINLILTQNDPAKEREAVQYMKERQVDGLILFSICTGENYTTLLKGLRVPVVTIYNRLSPDFVHVDVDCRQIMRNSVSYLVDKGYRRIIYLDPHFQEMKNRGINVYSVEERRLGYLEGMEEEMLGKGTIIEDFNVKELLSLVKQEKEPAVFICRNDTPAITLLNIFRRNGIRVPEDVGIMGFDNIEILDSISPRLTSVDCGIKTIGRKAVLKLLRLIQGEQGLTDCTVGYRIIEGESL